MTWGNVTDLLSWDNTLSFSVGVMVTLLVWFLTRVGNVASRRTEASIERIWDRSSARRKKRSDEKAEDQKRRAEAKHIERLRNERKGRLFRRRLAPGDPGMIGEVVDIDRRQPMTRVVMVWNSPAGRTTTEDDPAAGRPTTIEWKVLQRSPDEQRHLTARLIAKSHNDNDGWIEFEEIVE